MEDFISVMHSPESHFTCTCSTRESGAVTFPVRILAHVVPGSPRQTVRPTSPHSSRTGVLVL